MLGERGGVRRKRWRDELGERGITKRLIVSLSVKNFVSTFCIYSTFLCLLVNIRVVIIKSYQMGKFMRRKHIETFTFTYRTFYGL